MKTLYFSETSPADAAGDAILLPRSNFLGMDTFTATTTKMSFRKIAGTHDFSYIMLTHDAGKSIEAMQLVAATMASDTRSNVIDIVEAANTHPQGAKLSEMSSLITGVAITE